MNTQTTKHDPKTYAPSATRPADINALRETLKTRVAEKQATDAAIAARNTLTRKMAKDVADAVVEACEGIIERVELHETYYGILITVDGRKRVDVMPTLDQEAHTAVSVVVCEVSADQRRNRVCYHDVHGAAMAALRIITE